MSDLEIIADANNLYEAFNKAKSGSIYKDSVKRYRLNILKEINKSRKKILSGQYVLDKTNNFKISERGKTRYIKSNTVSDRVVLRSICDNFLIPKLTPYLIYDNGASLEGRGESHTRKRLETHLHRYYRKHGRDGYILLIDFSKFFDNIRHDIIIKMLQDKIGDSDALNIVIDIIRSFKIDVSYMNNDEYSNCMNVLFNSLEYAEIDESLLTGTKWMGKSLGIGNQVSQILGVFYTYPIDNYCKIVCGIKEYAKYMDDIYIIHHDKKFLQDLLIMIEKIAYEELGLFINKKKSHIVKLTHQFTFMNRQYLLTESGKVVTNLTRKTVTRERRRLKKYENLLNNNKIEYDKIEEIYKSRRGSLKTVKYSKRSVNTLDTIYNKKFIENWY